MKYLLHIDTSTDTGTVMLSGNGAVLGSRTTTETRNHASVLNTMISSLLEEMQLTLRQIDCIVVCAGPGSYTGLRIGMATAKGLCYAMDTPLITDSRLTLLAHQLYLAHPGYEQYVSLLVAREKEYFISIYDHNFNCQLQPQHIQEDQLQVLINNEKSTYIVSDVPASVIAYLNSENINIIPDIQISAGAWALYAFEKYNCNQTVNLQDADPFYLKQVYTHK